MVTTDLLMSGATTKQVGTVNICFFLVIILLFLIQAENKTFGLLQAKFFINVLAEPADVVIFCSTA